MASAVPHAACSTRAIMSFQPQTLETYRKASLVALWVGTLLYGVYLVLFGICIYIFRGRKQSQNIVLMVSAVAMFGLATTHIITIFISTFYAVLAPEKGLAPEHVALASGHIYITNNIIADGIIVYRCYIVWGSRKRIIIVPSILLLATAVLGYTFRITVQLIALSLVTSIMATGLTAGRILWIAGQTKKHLGKHFAQRYNTAFSIVVESGLVYSVSLIIFLVVYNTGPGSQSGPSKVYPAKYEPITTFPYFFPASYIVYVAIAQVMGIVSTLIIVRVGLGLSTTDNGTFAAEPTGERFSGPQMGTPRRPPAVSVELSTIILASPPTVDNHSSIDVWKAAEHSESSVDVTSVTDHV